MTAKDPPEITLLDKALLSNSGQSTTIGNESEIEILVVRALRKLVDAFSNIADETEPYDPPIEDENTELIEAEVVQASVTSTNSLDELRVQSERESLTGFNEDSETPSTAFFKAEYLNAENLKAEPTTGTPLE
ncbi:hypothetical protein FBU30_004338, partial [Linnemannia zychae]